jgi:predicted ferric reductase
MDIRINILETNDKHTSRIVVSLLAILLLGLIAIATVGFAGLLMISDTSMSAVIADLLAISDKTAWHLSRSAGTVAYVLLSGSTVWGLLQSSKIAKEVIPAGLSFAMHNILSWLALLFIGLHALVLLFDNYYAYSLPDLSVPFIGPYRPAWVGLGIISFYMMLMITISFQLRTKIGQRSWRTLHYLSFVVYLLATIHGLTAGTDSNKLGIQLMYLASGLLVLFLTNYRLLTSGSGASRLGRIRQRR